MLNFLPVCMGINTTPGTSVLFNLGFHAEYIWSPWSLLFHPLKVMLMAFVILFKICSAYCAKFMLPIFFIFQLFEKGNKKLKFTADIDFYDFFRFWKRLKCSNAKFERTEFCKMIIIMPFFIFVILRGPASPSLLKWKSYPIYVW